MKMRIGILADTHGFLDPQIARHFHACDEIWHAGDFGALLIAEQLSELKPLRGVFGNIDDQAVRDVYPEDLRFECCGVRVWMTHIAGHPGRYDRRVRQQLAQECPQLLICGHSHILRVDRDKRHQGLLCLNPGAAGHHGFHLLRTIVLADFADGQISALNIIELGPRGVRQETEPKRIELGPWSIAGD